jgi:hypothetical protein
VASATRLHFPDPNASPDDVEAFGVTLAVLVDRDDPSRSLLLNKPTNRERHTGGTRIQPGSFEEQALTEWVRHLATVPADTVAAARDRLASASAPAARDQLLRRLTHSQYNNTVRDLLGDHSRPADRFPPEDFVNGFRNQLRTQGMPPLLAEAYSAAAESWRSTAPRRRRQRPRPVQAITARDVKCAISSCVPSAAARSGGRSTPGVQRYTTLFTSQAGRLALPRRRRVVVVCAAVAEALHAEGRLRSEGVCRALRDREPLAYAWDTMPDERLFDAAVKGDCEPATVSTAWRGRCSTSRRRGRRSTSSSPVAPVRSGWAR